MTRAPRPKESAGLLLFRRRPAAIEVLLAHPGGPFFRNKDEGAWSIPKGELDGAEPALETARREFAEEIGVAPPQGDLHPLGSAKQRSGKTVHAWAVEGDLDPSRPVVSNTFTLEWPPGSGREQEFPEIDQARFFELAEARRRINPAQRPFLDALEQLLQHLP